MNKKKTSGNSKRRVFVGVIIALVVLIPLVFIIIKNNPQLAKAITSADSKQKKDKERALEFDKHAQTLLEPILIEMAKPVSPYKFVKRSLDEVEDYTWQALDIDSTLTTAWLRLGYITSHIHGEQALRRYESYSNQKKPEKAAEEEKNTLLYFAQAEVYYNKALEYGHQDTGAVYFLMAETKTIQHIHGQAAVNLLKALEFDPTNRKYEAKLIEAYLYGGLYTKALSQNELFRQKYPDSDIPYKNLGGYYYFIGDTARAVNFYEEAIEKGTNPDVGKLLHRYYIERGDTVKADYFLQKVYEANLHYDPEKY